MNKLKLCQFEMKKYFFLTVNMLRANFVNKYIQQS